MVRDNPTIAMHAEPSWRGEEKVELREGTHNCVYDAQDCGLTTYYLRKNCLLHGHGHLAKIVNQICTTFVAVDGKGLVEHI